MPEGWAWSRINQLYNFIDYRGATPNKIPSGIPLITAKNVKSGYIDYKSSEYISEEEYLERQQRGISRFGDILFTTEAPLGKVAIADIKKYSAGQRLITFQQYNNYLLSNKTFVNFILSDFFQKQLEINKTGSTVAGIKATRLKRLLIPVPPVKEQFRIDAVCDSIFFLIDSIESERRSVSEIIILAKSKILDLAIRGKLVQQDTDDEPASVLLERIRAEKEELIKTGKIKRDKKESIIFKGGDNSYYEKMSNGKVHFIDNELPFELPEGWEWCNLSMIGTTNIGLTYRPTDIEPEGVMVLRSCNIFKDQIDLTDLVRVQRGIGETQYAQENDILICTRNGSKTLVGKCALIPNFNEPTSFGAFMAIYRTIFHEFILHFLRSNLFRNIFDEGNSTAINQLTQDMLKRALVPFPPLDEQRRIAETINMLFSEISRIEKGLS